MKIAALGILFGPLAALFIGSVRAQEHRHPPQDAAIHEKFYKRGRCRITATSHAATMKIASRQNPGSKTGAGSPATWEMKALLRRSRRRRSSANATRRTAAVTYAGSGTASRVENSPCFAPFPDSEVRMTAWNDPPLSRCERFTINMIGRTGMLMALALVGWVIGGIR